MSMAAGAERRRASGGPDGRHRGRVPGRLLLPTERADLRVTWHQEDDGFVLSLWHDDVCVGTAPLSARDGAELASFLVTRLGERGTWTPRVVTEPSVAPTPAAGVAGALARLRRRFGRH